MQICKWSKNLAWQSQQLKCRSTLADNQIFCRVLIQTTFSLSYCRHIITSDRKHLFVPLVLHLKEISEMSLYTSHHLWAPVHKYSVGSVSLMISPGCLNSLPKHTHLIPCVKIMLISTDTCTAKLMYLQVVKMNLWVPWPEYQLTLPSVACTTGCNVRSIW